MLFFNAVWVYCWVIIGTINEWSSADSLSSKGVGTLMKNTGINQQKQQLWAKINKSWKTFFTSLEAESRSDLQILPSAQEKDGVDVSDQLQKVGCCWAAFCLPLIISNGINLRRPDGHEMSNRIGSDGRYTMLRLASSQNLCQAMTLLLNGSI